MLASLGTSNLHVGSEDSFVFLGPLPGRPSWGAEGSGGGGGGKWGKRRKRCFLVRERVLMRSQ